VSPHCVVSESDLLIERDILLGQVATRPIRVPAGALQLSAHHAQQLATSLGLGEYESSMSAYWSLETRLQQWQRIVDRLGLPWLQQAQMVEVGSGMGLFTLTGALLGFQISGVEYASDRYRTSLRVATTIAQHNNIELRFIQSPAEQLPLPDQSTDLVISFQTFEHVEDVAATLREIRRVLRPGGHLFAQVPNYAAWTEQHYGLLFPLGLGKAALRHYLKLRGKPTAFLEHLQWITPHSLEQLLHRTTFQHVSISRPSIASENTGWMQATIAPTPFRWQRNLFGYRLAEQIARVGQRLGLGPALEPQIEIWATAGA
jgi:ubiquinone/menaquinone biosynthesis C-methylase UbiE